MFLNIWVTLLIHVYNSGFEDVRGSLEVDSTQNYFTVDSKFERKSKGNYDEQQYHQNSPYKRPPIPVPSGARTSNLNSRCNLEGSKSMSSSVSWLEWTQQLQAYIAWVNSQLRKRSDLKQVMDLRSDLQSGEVLAQLIEIICKYIYMLILILIDFVSSPS